MFCVYLNFQLNYYKFNDKITTSEKKIEGTDTLL